MSEKTFKVHPGEEIEISIRRRRKDAENILGSRRRRGIIDPFARDEFLPRRLTNETGILFYDLGQLAGDDYTDNPHTITPDVVYTNTSSNLNAATAPVIADYRTREAIFIDNLATLEEDYRKLQKNDSEPLGVAVLGSGGATLSSLNLANPDWTNNGLKLTPEQLADSSFGIGSPVYNYTFRVNGPFVNPITAEPDPDADIVAFTPGAKDIYFLLPCFYSVNALNSKDSSATYLQYLNYFYRGLPRSVAVDPTNEFYGTALAGSKQWFKTHINPALTTFAAYNNAYNSARVARQLPGARMFEANGSGVTWNWVEETPPINFDNSTYSSLYPVYADGDYEHSNFTQLARLDSILLAIIKQEGDYFFVWNFAD